MAKRRATAPTQADQAPKSTVGRPRRSPGATSASSFSVRFTPRERQLIDDAGKARGTSSAALVRQASLDRAVHILNADEDGVVQMHRLAEKLARQADPEVFFEDQRATEHFGEPTGEWVWASKMRALLVEGRQDPVTDVTRLDETEIFDLIEVLETASTEFAPALIKALRTFRDVEKRYEARLRPGQLLETSGSGDVRGDTTRSVMGGSGDAATAAPRTPASVQNRKSKSKD